MSEDIDQIRAERDRLRAQLDSRIAALTPHPFANHRVFPAEVEAAARQRRTRVDAAVKDRQERDAALAAEREAARVEAGRVRLADYEGQAHQRFLHAGGSEGDWRGAWPKLKQDWLAEQSATDPKERDIQAKVEKLRADPSYSRF